MAEIQPQGFRAHIRELLSHESTALVPVTERNLARFDGTLTDLAAKSAAEDGMLNIDLSKVDETNAEWVSGVKALWVFGGKEANLAAPEQAAGFVNVYEPEHMGELNDMLKNRHMRPYEETGSVVEMGSYAKRGLPDNDAQEASAVKQALARVFMDEPFKDVRAVSIWVTHSADNTLHPNDEKALAKFGAIKLGALRYAPQETVDSTAFVIPRKAFMDSLTIPKPA